MPPSTAGTITDLFRASMHKDGFAWKLVPEEKKMEYFGEFKKVYTWPPEMESEVLRLWRIKAAKRYSDMIARVKKGYLTDGTKPPYIPDPDWEGWKAYWDKEDVKEKARKARMCRLSEPEGAGTGIIKHVGGSRSAQQYALMLAKEKNNPREKIDWEVFLRLHYKDGGGYTDARSKRLAEIVYERAAKLSQPLPGATEPQEVDMNQIFHEVSTVNDRNRKFDTGGRSVLFSNARSGSTSAASQFNTSAMEQQLNELQTQLNAEREERLTELHERQQKELELQEQLKRQADEHAKMKEQLDRLMQNWPPPS